MKYFKLLGIMSLLVFSFYLTDFVTELAIMSNPLMKSIQYNSEKYNVQSVNAVIDNNTIIPGISGKKVNDMESFLNMKDFGTFNINYLIYDDVKPEISLYDNKEKIIISGNKLKRQISLLVKNNFDIINYLNNNNIEYSRLVNNINIEDGENINISSDKELFNDIDVILNKNKNNKKICVLNYSNIDSCKEKVYYIVKPTIEINNNNFISYLKIVGNGDIILIDNNFTLDNFIVFLNRINNKDLKIVYLSEIIKE